MHKSLGINSLTKRDFLGLFKPSWEKSFNISNIQGGFEKAGIWPFSPQTVLTVISRRPITPPTTQDEPTKPPPTPLTSKSIRRAQKAYKDNPIPQNLAVILRSQERLAAQHEIDQHIQRGLIETLKKEKKRRKRGKRLNLVGEEDTGAQLFHSSRIRAALAYRAEQDALKEVETAAKLVKKAQALENKQRKEQEAEERALQRQVVKESKAQAKAIQLAAKEARKTQATLSKKDKKKTLKVVLPIKFPSKGLVKAVRFVEDVQLEEEGGGSEMRRSRTREVRLPHRFK